MPRPITGFTALSTGFRGIAKGTYYLESGAIDAARTTSASNLKYVGGIDRVPLLIQ